MEAYRTEEEQLEALKKWWQENSKSLFAAIALALAASFGWQTWQENKSTQAETASVIYQDMLDAVTVMTSGPASADQVATVRHLAGTLKADYASTSYAQFAALHLAKMAVAENDMEAAERELRWVLTSNPGEDLQLITSLRLARVVAARGDTSAALAMVQGSDKGSYAASYAEVEGDIYLQLNQDDQAREAYSRAAALILAEGGTISQSLQLKLDTLNPVAAPAVPGGS